MDKQRLAYRNPTVLFRLPMLGGGVVDVLHPADFLAEVAGAVTLLLPGLPRLKEWAHAGFAFDLLGALASRAAVGHGNDEFAPPVLLLLIGAARRT